MARVRFALSEQDRQVFAAPEVIEVDPERVTNREMVELATTFQVDDLAGLVAAATSTDPAVRMRAFDIMVWLGLRRAGVAAELLSDLEYDLLHVMRSMTVVEAGKAPSPKRSSRGGRSSRATGGG